MSIQRGTAFIFGVDAKWFRAPILGVPADAVRIRRRFRHNDAAKAFVKSADGSVAGYYLQPSTGWHSTSTTMTLGHCFGVNWVRAIAFVLIIACSGCTVVSANRVFPTVAWRWSKAAQNELEYRRLAAEYRKSQEMKDHAPHR